MSREGSLLLIVTSMLFALDFFTKLVSPGRCHFNLIAHQNLDWSYIVFLCRVSIHLDFDLGLTYRAWSLSRFM